MRNVNFMIHRGGQVVPFEQVVLTPTPKATETFCPVPHHVLVDNVRESLDACNLRVVHEQHALDKYGDRYFGLMQIANGHASDDIAWVLGLRNSHDHAFSAALVAGEQVFVCDNLSFSGEIEIRRKHTSRIWQALRGLVEQAVGRLTDFWQGAERRVDAYKGYDLTDAEAHDLLIRSVDSRVLPVTYLPKVLTEYREPKHPEFEHRNAWSLKNAVTEVLKGSSPNDLVRRTTALHGLLDGRCGITAPETILQHTLLAG